MRNDYVITNNSAQSLFSIPKNKRFVFYNSSKSSDPLDDSIDMLLKFIAKADSSDRNDQENDDDECEIRPYRGYAKPYALDLKNPTLFNENIERSFISLIKVSFNSKNPMKCKLPFFIRNTYKKAFNLVLTIVCPSFVEKFILCDLVLRVGLKLSS